MIEAVIDREGLTSSEVDEALGRLDIAALDEWFWRAHGGPATDAVEAVLMLAARDGENLVSRLASR